MAGNVAKRCAGAARGQPRREKSRNPRRRPCPTPRRAPRDHRQREATPDCVTLPVPPLRRHRPMGEERRMGNRVRAAAPLASRSRHRWKHGRACANTVCSDSRPSFEHRMKIPRTRCLYLWGCEVTSRRFLGRKQQRLRSENFRKLRHAHFFEDS